LFAGHSAGGASSIDDGVVLDLSRHFGQVEVVLGDGAHIKAGGGSRWGEVDKKAMEHGSPVRLRP
jgi:FAD/FMN-containing dehydrogenase